MIEKPTISFLNNRRGNALFLILIAVALFAALSYAVTRSGRGGGGIAKEQLELNASGLIAQMSSIRAAVQRQTLLGCPKDQLSYEGAAGGSYANVNKYPSDVECLVFNPLGGGQAYQSVDTSLLDPAYSAATGFGRMYFVRSLLIDGATYSNDIVVPYVSNEACLAINKKLHGHSAIPKALGTTAPLVRFTGIFNTGDNIACGTNPVPGVGCGTGMGCFQREFSVTGTDVNFAYMQAMRNPP